MNDVLILTDYRGAFYSTHATRRTTLTLNVHELMQHISAAGFSVRTMGFADVRPVDDLCGVHVLYTSSEDDLLAYKSYIEDVILYLTGRGAILLPDYRFLRAHHNKAYMELLRCELFPEQVTALDTRIFGSLQELSPSRLSKVWPKVIKSAYGAGSASVRQARDYTDLRRMARRMSHSIASPRTKAKEIARRVLRRGYQARSMHRDKFIVQNCIGGLSGDFKVLCMGSRYYWLYRQNRPNDFRASGSGIFSRTMPEGVHEDALLGFARSAYKTLGTPLASLDIAFDGSSFHLIEFQTLHFGTLAAESSEYYSTYSDGGWLRVPERCNIEAVFADAIVLHILNNSDSA